MRQIKILRNPYFQSYQNYFWQWEEEGRIIGIPNGRTIAYTPFVAETLDFLKDQGIPRFGTLLLAILATSRDARFDILRVISDLKANYPSLGSHHLEAIGKAENFLLELTALPPAYKEGSRRRLVLQTILKSIRSPIRPWQAKDIIGLISSDVSHGGIVSPKVEITPQDIYSDFHPFIKLCKDFPDAASILEAMGELPETEEELPLPEEKPEPIGDFLQELLQRPETADIGALIPRIWSALEIPFHNRLPGQQPMGGVAGLGNKGEAHRLLASEFANDDLVLLSRLANNEALYLNPETPPQSDNRERVLLVDVSLKNWGTPHTVAFALMLAIARHPKSSIPCSAYALHEGWQPLRFDDIHQIIEGLLALESCLHPGGGMERFFRENPEKLNAEIFLLTTADTLRLPAMQQSMAKFQHALSYWLLSDHQGGVDLYKKRGQGRKHVKSFQLPIDELWRKKPGAHKKVWDVPPRELIRTYFSLLLPPPPKISALLSVGGEIYAVTGDHALIRNAGKQPKYWEMVYDNLPPSSDHFEMGRMPTGNPVLLAFSSKEKKGFLLDIVSGEKTEFTFEEWNPAINKGFVFYEGRFYCPGEASPISWEFYQHELRQEPLHLNARVKELLDEKNRLPESLRQGLSFSTKILKNIHRVWINENRNLVFNRQELVMERGNFFMKPTRGDAMRELIVTNNPAKNEFTFPEGSQVTGHPAGILILSASNPDIPKIFISSVVDKALCLVADGYFSGNENFANPEFKLMRLDVASFKQRFLAPFIQQITQ